MVVETARRLQFPNEYRKLETVDPGYWTEDFFLNSGKSVGYRGIAESNFIIIFIVFLVADGAGGKIAISK